MDPSVAAEVLARGLLRPDATLVLAGCFRPVLLQLSRCLLDNQQELTETHAAAYYTALVQVLEIAPHLERYVGFAGLHHIVVPS